MILILLGENIIFIVLLDNSLQIYIRKRYIFGILLKAVWQPVGKRNFVIRRKRGNHDPEIKGKFFFEIQPFSAA